MFIKIIVVPEYLGHAYLYAWEQDPEEKFPNIHLALNSIRFQWGLVKNCNFVISETKNNGSPLTEEAPSQDYDNDNFVILESPVSFVDFYSQLKDLESKSHYNWSKNNCIDGVIHALRLAKIPIEFDDNSWRTKKICGSLFCPTSINTPLDIFSKIQNHKMRTLVAANIFPRYEQEKKALSICISIIDDKEKILLVQEIIKKIDDQQKQRKEHTDFYLHILQIMHSLIKNKPSEKDIRQFNLMAEHFKKREKPSFLKQNNDLLLCASGMLMLFGANPLSTFFACSQVALKFYYDCWASQRKKIEITPLSQLMRDLMIRIGDRHEDCIARLELG